MKIIISPDSFKGSLTSVEAANAIERGVKKVFPNADIYKMPVADGGEGTVDVLSHIKDSVVCKAIVQGPLGSTVEANYLMTKENTAIIEMAQASGITLLKKEELNPMLTSTFGTGQLIIDALEHGAQKIVLAIGGSATNDGGAGLAQAIGISIKDSNNNQVVPNCAGLANMVSIDSSAMDERIKSIPIEIACDVTNTLCGKNGASQIYGYQKGATVEMAEQMDDILFRYAKEIENCSGMDVLNIPGSGAAGGIAVPLLAFAGAKIVSGIEAVLTLIDFDKEVQTAQLVITGEGRIDRQTCFGKVIAGILKKTAPKNIPVIAFCGSLQAGYEDLFQMGLTSCFSILSSPMELEVAIQNADPFLEDTTVRAMKMLTVGCDIS